MEKQIKRLQYKIADIDERQRLVKAYFSAFGNVDSDGDVIVKGAGRKTIQENGPGGKDIIRHFLNHEMKYNPAVLPIGKIKEMGEDNFGNYFVSKIARTKTGEDIYSLYEDGFINNHSFGFNIIKQRQENNVNYILEYKMYEVSTVTTWSSNENTPTIEVKEKKEQTEAATEGTSINKYESLFIEPSKLLTPNEEADLKAINEIYKLLKFN